MVRVVDLESLALHHCGFESHQVLGILSCDEAIQLSYGMLVVLLKFQLESEIMQSCAGDLPTSVKLESHHNYYL